MFSNIRAFLFFSRSADIFVRNIAPAMKRLHFIQY